MFPFQKNFQRFLVFFFTAISIVLVIMGINRSKNGALSAIPTQGQPDTGVTPVTPNGAPTPSQGSSKFTGKTYQTPWGNVVAGITVTNGKITGVTMPEVPNSPPSIYAEPYLVQQALALGTANIQGVSGATYTSIAFKASLESAISQASAHGQTVAPVTSTVSTTVTTPTTKPSVPRRYRDDDEWDD